MVTDFFWYFLIEGQQESGKDSSWPLSLAQAPLCLEYIDFLRKNWNLIASYFKLMYDKV